MQTNKSKTSSTINTETFVVGLPRIDHIEVQVFNPIILGFQPNINVDPMEPHYATIEVLPINTLTI